MRGPLRSLAAQLILGLLAAAPAGAQATPDEVARAQVERLRDDDPAIRLDAIKQLKLLGGAARPALRRALRDPDPEVRFHALQLLNQAGGELLRGLRAVLEQAAASGDGSAIRSFQALAAKTGPETIDRLIHLAERELRVTGRGKPVLAVVALDLLADLAGRGASLSKIQLNKLTRLLGLDSGSAFHTLTMVFGAAPYERVLPALRSVLSGGSPGARVRAALTLGLITPSARARDGHAALTPLLRHKVAKVRLAAIQALDQLDLQGAGPFLPVAKLVTDPSPEVAAEAIRVAGERKQAVVADPCRRLLQDSKQPLAVRKQAARTLGLLGNPAAAATLRALTEPRVPRELRILSAWALGAVRAPDARSVLLPLIRGNSLSQEQALFFGLARSGGPEARRALFDQIRMPNPMPRGRDPVILLRGRAARALRASAALTDPGTSRDLAELARQPRALRSDLPGPTIAEVRLAIEALGARGDDESRLLVGSVLLDPTTTQARETCLEVLGQVGLPEGPDPLRLRVVEELVREVQRGRRLRVAAADALARIDPARARMVLRTQRFGGSRARRDLARSLARAGDPSLIARYALPLSRSAVKTAAPGRRVDALNNVGIDLLYGRDYAQALLVFRRMTWSQPDHQLAAYNAACAHALNNEPEKALRWLRQAVFRLGYKNPRHMAADTDLTVLRTDRRFQRLLRQLRLADETQMSVPELRERLEPGGGGEEPPRPPR